MALRLKILLSAVLLLAATPWAFSQSAACNQARSIVAGIAAGWQAGQSDYAQALAKLATARSLCPALGDVWKYSYCLAKALGDDKKAGFYREQAILNGVSQVECKVLASVSEPLPSFVRQKFALVVGVSRFVDSSIHQLRFAAKDARDLRDALVHPGFGRFPPDNVYLLTDEQATRANILKALNEIALRAQEQDLVLVFFSSHGSPRKDRLGLQGIGYIVTHDTRQSEIFVEALAFEDLREKLQVISARRKVLLLDTCYSGQSQAADGKALTLESFGVDPGAARLFLSGEGTYVVTSSSESEPSYESNELQNGYFTHFLIEALKQSIEPPTVQQVYAYLRQKVREAVARDKQAAQNPRLFPEDGRGDVRIGVAIQP